ncbi:MAG: preprotein translocase subunit SecE [Patescibacteria group bacterium]|nr:preprotein translocase subunit SecE [Patescibacteria group bacterium]MBU1876873.1 preprotein translocase subunit SecE [Patescibacteria group bacterium]
MKNILIGIKDFLKEVRLELKRVNWPNKKETINYTLIVIGTLTVVAMYLGAIDFLFSRGLNKLIQ